MAATQELWRTSFFYKESSTLRIFLPEAPWEIVVCFQSCSGSFPCTVEHPMSGSVVTPTNVSSATQPVPIALSSKSATPCAAWTRAVKAKRGMGSADKRAEAFHKILSLLNAFASFFDLVVGGG